MAHSDIPSRRDSGKVVGVIAYVIRDISTPQDRGRYSAIVFLRSLVISPACRGVGR